VYILRLRVALSAARTAKDQENAVGGRGDIKPGPGQLIRLAVEAGIGRLVDNRLAVRVRDGATAVCPEGNIHHRYGLRQPKQEKENNGGIQEKQLLQLSAI